MRKKVAGALLVAATALVALARLLAPGGAEPGSPPREAPREVARPSPSPLPPPGAAGALRLDALADERLAAQVAAVVESMDRTGRPPAGVAQGGRRGARRGEFANAEGRLPRRAPGHYTETDVWPRQPGRSRGTHRLVLGREGEVYYTADHYRTFTRLR